MDNEKEERAGEKVGEVLESRDDDAPETGEHPVPGVEHEQEPDAGNIMPAKDRPGTL